MRPAPDNLSHIHFRQIFGLHLGQQDDVGSRWDNLLIPLPSVVVEIGFLPDLSALPRSHEDRTESEKHPIAPPMTKFGVSIVEDEHHRDKADYKRNNVFSDIRPSNLRAPGGCRASSSTRCADVQAISQS